MNYLFTQPNVIPAQAGIQGPQYGSVGRISFQVTLDSRPRRNDEFLYRKG